MTSTPTARPAQAALPAPAPVPSTSKESRS